jgi:hypothetical protein
MKNHFFVFFIFLFSNIAFSQNLPSFRAGTYIDANSYYERQGGIYFTFYENGRVNGIRNGEPKNGTFNGSYTVIEENGLNYLQILWDNKTRDKYLIIGYIQNGYIDDFNLYNKDGAPFFSCGTTLNPDYMTYFQGNISTEAITATSELREGNIVYSTKNLDDRIGVCWAVRGGIGEKIIINKEVLGDLYIATGFISMEKPHLYRENSRPKKIRVSYEGKDSKIVELADTYHVQSINFGAYTGRDVWIEILEVYPGSKYKDLCINLFRRFITN